MNTFYKFTKIDTIFDNYNSFSGKINKNMNPCQYMQMYSYGVHLLEALMVSYTKVILLVTFSRLYHGTDQIILKCCISLLGLKNCFSSRKKYCSNNNNVLVFLGNSRDTIRHLLSKLFFGEKNIWRWINQPQVESLILSSP